MTLETLPRTWDAVVVGAGIAGSALATRLARRGLTVLLVEKSGWPRDKVCGGCLSAVALRELHDGGLGVVGDSGRPYAEMRLAMGRREAVFSLPAGRAVTRRRLDAALAAGATAAGAYFLPTTHAALGAVRKGRRELSLRSREASVRVAAALVLDCSGLAGHLGASPPDGLEVATDAYIGVGTVIHNAPAACAAGAIHMACGRHGYVGLVRAEGDAINVGAALDPAWVKDVGGPAPAVTAILDEAGLPLPDALTAARWRGTPRLTRRRQCLGAARVLVLGDAAGYVEPFTGEGMAWALADAAAVEPVALAAVTRWQDDLVRQWTRRHAEVSRTRQHVCRSVTRLLRHPHWFAAGLKVIEAAPVVVAPLVAWLNRDFRLGEGFNG